MHLSISIAALKGLSYYKLHHLHENSHAGPCYKRIAIRCKVKNGQTNLLKGLGEQ